MQPESKPNQDQFNQVVDRLKSANNVLVTVSTNPSVDQLASCIGLTLALNKQNKHATAVFSGEPPSTIEFLKPSDTLEKNTDSLRDFIISLDKSKADKLRYKVENDVVKIFITPYRTSISETDFDFSQGDFNVDAVVAIGVKEKNDLDATIVAHGRILHDATVISVNTVPGAELGSINLLDTTASSLCEMISDLVGELGKDLYDAQIATALLTGIVAETDRFKNEKSNPHTMSVAGTLMSAGASTQLIASKLEEPVAPAAEIPQVVDGESSDNHDGMIEIDHEQKPEDSNIHIDDSGNLKQIAELEAEQENQQDDSVEDDSDNISGPSIITEPPRLGGQLTANSVPEYQQYTDSTDPLSAPSENGRILTRSPIPDQPPAPMLDSSPAPITDPISSELDTNPAVDEPPRKTLADIEDEVHSPHTQANVFEPTPPKPPEPTVEEIERANATPPPIPDDARDAVQRAVEAVQEYKPEPIEALGANPVNLDLGHDSNLQFEENNGTTTPPIGPPPPVPPPMMPPANS